MVTLTYNGAGYAGAKTPSADDILKGAEKAVREAVAAVAGTDAGAGSGEQKSSPSPSKSSSDKA